MSDAALSLCSQDELSLLNQAKTGDHGAFKVLYDRHKARVYSICLRMTSDASDAQDLTQETFTQCYRKIGSFRGESQLSTWIYRLAVNTVLMFFRKKKLSMVSLDEPIETKNGEKRDYYDILGARDQCLETAIDRQAIERAIADLPHGYRTIYVLHEIEGYEHQEIAQILGCSIGNSKSQLHKARLSLFERLNPHGDRKRFERSLEEIDKDELPPSGP